MKAIAIKPRNDPEVITAPDTLQAIERYLGGPVEMRVFPRAPAAIFFRTGHDLEMNRQWRGHWIYGPILCYGWSRNNIRPLAGKQLQELMDRFKRAEVTTE